ncbi:MAG: hypothetical protein ACU84H_02605 [Gammaproteobacteria bacterium]
MSDIEEKKSRIIKARGELQTIHADYGLMKVNRMLVAVVFSLMTLVLILGFLLFPDQAINFKYKRNLSNQIRNMETGPVLSAEVNHLKGQMIGLVSGSIESKLRVLEESLRIGSVSSSLGTIEDLKNDIKVLRSYSQPVEKKEEPVFVNEQILLEVSQLKKLIYVSLASCGLMLAAVAGIWLKNNNRLPYKKVINHYLGKH